MNKKILRTDWKMHVEPIVPPEDFNTTNSIQTRMRKDDIEIILPEWWFICLG